MDDKETKQLKIARKNIARLITRVHFLEDRLEKLDDIKTLRPQYVIDIGDDNGLPIG